jgi:hypothetical protein
MTRQFHPTHANGSYLTGDSGYAGIPMTAHHNTTLIDGKGQAREGKGHDVPYERLNQIRIVEAKLDATSVSIRGDATASYEPELGFTRFIRTFTFSKSKGFTVQDELAAKRSVWSAATCDAAGEVRSENAKLAK